MTFNEKTERVITRQNALEWKSSSERWMFVTDLITACGISYDLHGANIERRVRSIENRFEKLLKEEHNG